MYCTFRFAYKNGTLYKIGVSLHYQGVQVHLAMRRHPMLVLTTGALMLDLRRCI